MKHILKIFKKHAFHKKSIFLRKKSRRQGCTKPKTELGMHQNLHFHENALKINQNPKINPPSTITIPEPAGGVSSAPGMLPGQLASACDTKSIQVAILIGLAWAVRWFHEFV